MVRKQNFSRKRQAILEALRNTKIHPTAEWVHQTLKNDYPDLTVIFPNSKKRVLS